MTSPLFKTQRPKLATGKTTSIPVLVLVQQMKLVALPIL